MICQTFRTMEQPDGKNEPYLLYLAVSLAMGKKERSSHFVSSGRVIGYHYLCCYYWLKTTETDCLVVLQSRSLKSRRGRAILSLKPAGACSGASG